MAEQGATWPEEVRGDAVPDPSVVHEDDDHVSKDAVDDDHAVLDSGQGVDGSGGGMDSAGQVTKSEGGGGWISEG